MRVPDVASAMGVLKSRVKYWISRGWLKATLCKSHHVIRNVDLRQFLYERGALFDGLAPNFVWKPIVTQARAALLARYIAVDELAILLVVQPKTFISTWRERAGFPYAVQFAGRRVAYYRRSDVRAWLDAHPERWTKAAREQL